MPNTLDDDVNQFISQFLDEKLSRPADYMALLQAIVTYSKSRTEPWTLSTLHREHLS